MLGLVLGFSVNFRARVKFRAGDSHVTASCILYKLLSYQI